MGVEKYEVVATLDLRTSDICRKLDGKVFDVKDYERGVTAPPFHVYCRSTTVPYYNDDIQADIENSRLARDPETGKSLRVEKLTYKEWYKKYITKEVKQEQGQFFFKADLLTEKGYNNLRYYVSGAITDSYSKEARNHAQLYYEEIRNQKTDIDRISKNTGYDKRLIEEIKNYLFYEEHDIYGIKRRFDPDFSIAQSWQRLAQDEIEKHDLTLINHEIMERRLIAKGLTQDEAHKIASKKYNYRKESSEYYAKIKERRKKG